MEVLPIFSSYYSTGRSILSLEEPEDITINKPISIFSIAKKYNLDNIFISDSSFSGFIQAYKNSIKNNIQIKFGIKLCICDDLNKKDEESFRTESNVILWLNNSKAYKTAIKIYSKAATDGFYYIPRLDWVTLNSMIDDNIKVTIPFYDSFLHNNSLKGYNVVPSFNNFNPIFHIENNNLPFNYIINKKIQSFLLENSFSTIGTKSIYYFRNSDFINYLTFRCIQNRTTLNKPNLNHFSSNEFSFENWCQLSNKNFNI